MENIWRSAVALMFLAMGGMGCQNRVYEDNKGLRKQNLELQSQLDDANRQQAPVAQPVALAPPVQASSPTPRYVEPSPIPQPTPVAPAAQPDFGNFEVVRNIPAGTTTVNLPSDVLFASGQAMLLPEAKRSLGKLVIALKKDFGSKQIRIVGNTDSDPIVKSHWKSNQELSEKRAEAVRDYLVSKGVNTSRISTEGRGDLSPKSKTDKAKNRRVELVVMTQ